MFSQERPNRWGPRVDGDGIITTFQYSQDTPSESIPDEVASVRLDAFVREIGVDAFRDHQKLTEVVFVEGLRSIGERAFCDCTS